MDFEATVIGLSGGDYRDKISPMDLRNAASQMRSVQGVPRTRYSMSDREFGGQSYPASTNTPWLINI